MLKVITMIIPVDDVIISYNHSSIKNLRKLIITKVYENPESFLCHHQIRLDNSYPRGLRFPADFEVHARPWGQTVGPRSSGWEKNGVQHGATGKKKATHWFFIGIWFNDKDSFIVVQLSVSWSPSRYQRNNSWTFRIATGISGMCIKECAISIYICIYCTEFRIVSLPQGGPSQNT